MDYCERSDIENVFGSKNVALWADMNNSRVAGEIAARIRWAITQASNDIDAALRGSYYHIPLQTLSGDIPAKVRDLCATLSGCILYEPRGIEDLPDGKTTHQLAWHRKQLQEDLDAIRVGTLRLDAI